MAELGAIRVLPAGCLVLGPAVPSVPHLAAPVRDHGRVGNPRMGEGTRQ